MKNKFNETYNQIVLEIKYRDINNLNVYSSSIPSFEAGIIYEDCAFHKLPRCFTDKLIDEINQMKENKIIEKEIDARNYLQLIKKEEVENFQEFFDFIQLLIHSSEKILTLKMGFENSYNEPIELFELCNEEYSKVFHKEPKKDDLIKKIKNKSFSKALQIMKENLNEFHNLGTLTINPKTITKDMYVYDSNDTIIGHEIRHFIIFLQRWSKMNYEVCKKYSIQKINDKNTFKNYSLYEDEFITLSSTLIERLINIFLKNKRLMKIQEVNQLIKSVLVKTGEYNKDILNNDLYWYDILNNNDQQINSIIEFYKNILNDRKYKFENNIKTKNDKFITLIKWTYNSFMEKLKNLKI